MIDLKSVAKSVAKPFQKDHKKGTIQTLKSDIEKMAKHVDEVLKRLQDIEKSGLKR